MPEALRVPFKTVLTQQGEAMQRPMLPLTLIGKQSISADGLVDSGADVNVLPYSIGVSLGLEWNSSAPQLHLSGNLAQFDAQGVIVKVQTGDFEPVLQAFAWTSAENVPLILGQVSFFMSFDVCFFRSSGFFEIRPAR